MLGIVPMCVCLPYISLVYFIMQIGGTPFGWGGWSDGHDPFLGEFMVYVASSEKLEQMKYIGRIIRSDFRRIDGTVFLSDAERPGVPI